ncbi:MAG: pentapeptide repeat-containing protein [Gammaproteobacteria bacterium]|nr:pentapeptide repeat-containing protein [Gammaproteobacteria bacterium]
MKLPRENETWVFFLGIILVPVSVAAVSMYIDTRIDDRQRELATELNNRQERLAITQTVDSYFQGVGDILASGMPEAQGDRIIIARTNALLRRIEAPMVCARVVRFVSDVRPKLLRAPKRQLERGTPHVSLAGLDLSGTDLGFTTLVATDLRGARLKGTRLAWSSLREARLDGAELAGADLRGADLTGANLEKTNLRGASIGGASFVQAQLSGADLRDVDRNDVLVDGLRAAVDFSGANLDGALQD